MPTCLSVGSGYGEGMSMTAPFATAPRLCGAGVVRAVLDIAGARHEVLPPRMTCAGAVSLVLSTRRAPP